MQSEARSMEPLVVEDQEGVEELIPILTPDYITLSRLFFTPNVTHLKTWFSRASIPKDLHPKNLNPASWFLAFPFRSFTPNKP